MAERKQVMNPVTHSTLFEIIHQENGVTGLAGWWTNIRPTKAVSSSYPRRFQQASDLMLLSVAVLIGLTVHTSFPTLFMMELIFLGMYVLLLLARIFSKVLLVVGIYLMVIGLAGLLNVVFPGQWGTVYLYNLCVVTLYRFPLRWALLLASACILTLIGTSGVLGVLLPSQQSVSLSTLALNILVSIIVGWVGWTLRSQYLLMVRLEEVQAQLHLQMQRNEEIAAERERTRIARDIHDVLSHSLAVLSIQVQAARQLVNRDPGRLSAKLEDMAQLIRESITESRQVVGLLRETASSARRYHNDALAASLQEIASTFKARTGIDCLFEETGEPQPLNLQQRETLQLALREMLTNSHRHGAARTTWISLQWQPTRVSLEVSDDGRSLSPAAPEKSLGEAGEAENGINDAVGGHHGLQGMQERAEALGGEIKTGRKDEAGGFIIKLSLPLGQSPEKTIKG